MQIQVNLVEVWQTYLATRGLYFYYVAAAYSLPLKKDAGFAVVPHLLKTRHTPWKTVILAQFVNMRKKSLK